MAALSLWTLDEVLFSATQMAKRVHFAHSLYTLLTAVKTVIPMEY